MMGFDWHTVEQNPVGTFLSVVVVLICGVLGFGPGRAWFQRTTREQQAGAVEAGSEAQNIRRGDAVADSWQHIAERAMKQRDDAFDAKQTALDVARVALEAAKQEVHDAKNDAFGKISAFEQEAKMRIGEAETKTKAAEDRATEAEIRAKSAESRVAMLETEVQGLQLQIVKLNRRLDALAGVQTDFGGLK